MPYLSLCDLFPSIEENSTMQATEANINKNSNTYCRWRGPGCMCHWMTRIFHWIANQIGSSGAADELSSCDAHLNTTSTHHTVGGHHGCHLCWTSLSIKVISSSVLAVHLCFCIWISCCSALEGKKKGGGRNLLALPAF